ncbi:DUF1552 domain-containing protein [Planctomycetes bacterium K23_9]|uniref:DUF1552 domain-containing protein n=1 Tax=Stieleria marina TaxID=1930275 RepID=A0A517NM70_9BACT|nr:hypothetical protein K239x_01510 [Planctomycetes bacterium K23_9]
MNTDRRTLLQGLGGVLALPILENALPRSSANAAQAERPEAPKRFLVVGNPLGMHPENFFPADFGTDFQVSPTLKALEWLQGRFTILSHTDHSMKSGHGRELSFLSGVLPETAHAFAEKNMSLDQFIARQISGTVRYSSIHAALETGIRMVYNGNGVEIKPFTDVNSLYDYLFLNFTREERRVRKELFDRNGSILDSVKGQFSKVWSDASASDRQRLEQFATSVRDLEGRFDERTEWIDRDKPKFDLSKHLAVDEVTLVNRYSAIFDMIAYAFQTDLTRVATVSFPNELNYTDVNGVNRGYHACTHNGKNEDIVAELVAIESFQIAQMSAFLMKLDAIDEPNAEGSMLDHTVVLFGSGMGYGGTHSCRNLPILVAGGGFKHRGHVDTRDASGNNMPLCNLYLSLMQHFGIERDSFNVSTGAFELNHA